MTIRVIGDGKEMRRFVVAGVEPGTDRTQVWDGLNSAGVPVPDGTYRVLVGDGAGSDKDAGSVFLHSHRFPVLGGHGTRGAEGEFGAARRPHRLHRGFDITAPCGRTLVAARSGVVVRHDFARLDGNFVVIAGLGERRTYTYAHLVRPSPFQKGDEVHIGDVVGHIGQTGNAAGTPCHLHFEIHRRGRPIDPEPDLRAWDRYS